jgi:uncharacterized protein (DUF2384 family)
MAADATVHATGPAGPPLEALLTPTGLACLALGLVVLALHSHAKFAETTIRPASGDYIAQFLPRYLATREEYARALIGYLASMGLILVVMSIIGRPLLEVLTDKELAAKYAPVAPLGFALLLIGVLPNIPWLQNLEWLLRSFWHERAYIPQAARAAADTLRACAFDFSGYRGREVLDAADMRGVEAGDFSAPRASIEHGWARLSCLCHELQQRRHTGELAPLDPELIERFASDLDAIAAARRAMIPDIAAYRAAAGSASYDTEPLHTALTTALRRLYILIGCAVRVRLRRSEDANTTFRSFGFEVPPSTAASGNQDVILLGLFGMTVPVLLVAFAAVEISELAKAHKWWEVSPRFLVNTGFLPFVWALSAAIVHGAAIVTAELIRTHRVHNGTWFAGLGGEPQINVAQYVRVGLVCAFTGGIALYVCTLVTEHPTVKLAIALLPFMTLPAATGAFYAWHLDNAELGVRPPRRIEIGLQASVTALCGLVGTAAWVSLPQFGDHADFVVLVALTGAVVGAALAACLPVAAANRRRRDPQVIARNARIATLRAAALAHFGSASQAEAWLAQPHPELGNLTPLAAAADVELCVKAQGLLHRPSTPVAA